MKDLREMIDDTTERLLKKVDNWEVPQSDKKYVTIEKEVWESTLKASMDRAGKIETLQKQLDIAIEGLKKYESGRHIFSDNDGISTGSMKLAADRGQTARKYLKRIEELNNE